MPRIVAACRDWGLVSVSLLLVPCCGGRTQYGLEDGGVSPSSSTPNPIDPADWDGGLLPSTPGEVRCGSVECAAPAEECCLVPEGSETNGCDTRGGTTCNGNQLYRECDQQSDCHANEICCYEFATSPPVTLDAVCVPLDDSQDVCSGYWVACGSDADCAEVDAGTCYAQRCRGDILQTCGELPTDACPP